MTDGFYVVSFDLLQSQGRQNEYAAAETMLRFRFGHTNVWKPLKQFHIVRTDQGAGAIRNALRQRLGQNCNILVVRIRKGYAFKITDARKRREARDCLEQLPER